MQLQIPNFQLSAVTASPDV